MPRKVKRRSDFYDFYSSAEQKDFPHPKKSFVPLIVFFFFVALLSTSAWYGVTLFSKKGGGPTDPLVLTVKAPAEVQQGEVIEYAVHYKNTSDISFPSAELFATYPERFVVALTTPEATNEKKNFWNIGVLGPRAEGDITIRGIFQAGAQGSQSLGLSLHYEHPTYHSSFVVKSESVVTISDQEKQRIQVEGPVSLHIGDPFTYTIWYSDFTDLGNLDAILVQVNVPTGFTLTEQKPTPKDANGWEAFSLQSLLDPITHEGTLILKGLVDTSDPGSQHIITKVVQKSSNGSTVTLLEHDTEVQILGGDLVLTFATQNKIVPTPIQFGAKVPLTLSFENKGTSTYHNVTLTLTRKGSLALFSQADAPGAIKDADHISWNASGNKSLETIAPQAKGDISFILPIDQRSALEQMQFAPADLAVSLTLSAKSEKQEDLDGKTVEKPADIVGPTLTMPLLSDAHFEAFVKSVPSQDASVQGGDVLRVYWSLENSLHELSDLRMEGVLPKGVQWIGEHARTAGDISYSPATRVVAWTLNKLPSSVHRIDGSFDIKVIQATKDSSVVRDARLTAKDSVLANTITQIIPVLTLP